MGTEFWRRFPVLHGWRMAILHLGKAQVKEWQDEHPDRGFLAMPPIGATPPGAALLNDQYKRAVDRIAADASQAGISPGPGTGS